MIEVVEITLIKFKDSNGVLHHTVEEAELAEKKLQGDCKVCPECQGSKVIVDPFMGIGAWKQTCRNCDSNGLVWKREVWV